MMKTTTLFTLALGGMLAAGTGFAGPVQKDQIAADAKWLIHLDLDNFHGTKIGAFLGEEFLDKQLKRPVRDLQKNLGIEFDWRKIHSLTAYGNDYRAREDGTGVLLIDSGLDLGGMLDTVIDKLSAQTGGGAGPVEKVQEKPFVLYSSKNIFGAPVKDNLFLVSRSREDLEKSRQVLLGKSANLTASKAFSAFPEGSKAFFLLGLAEGFEKAPLPPQAKMFQNAEGGQIMLGELTGKCFLNVALRAKDAETATQIQQLLQGLIAMVSLNKEKVEDKDLQQLAQAAKISANEKIVTLKLELPVTNVIARVTAEQDKRGR